MQPTSTPIVKFGVDGVMSHVLWQMIVAVGIGAATALAFEPVGFASLAILGPALLYRLLYASRHNFRLGFCFGLGYFGLGVSWVFVSIHDFAFQPTWLAALLTLLFISFLSLYSGFMTWLCKKLSPTLTFASALIFPLTWVLADVLRGSVFSGFPWLMLGYSQTASILAGFIPLIGIYAVSGLCVLLGTSLVLTFTYYADNKLKSAASLSFIIATLVVGHFLFYIDYTKPVGKPIHVSVVQGNASAVREWQPALVVETIRNYIKLTRNEWDSDWIIWPEAAIPVTDSRAHTLLSNLKQEAILHDSTLLAGIYLDTKNPDEYTNGLIMVGINEGHYSKRQLVPFGEYMPFGNLLADFKEIFAVPSGFVPGAQNQKPLTISSVTLAPLICYEVAFASLVKTQLPDANVLLTLSNDAWFGHSLAPAQHLQIAKARALQTGREHIVSTNNGITAIIDNKGRVKKSVPSFTVTVLRGEVQPRRGETPWVWLVSQ